MTKTKHPHSTNRAPDALFCYKCGSPCIKTKYILNYHSDTGDPYFAHNYRCPKKRWWNSHEDEDYTESGCRMFRWYF